MLVLIILFVVTLLAYVVHILRKNLNYWKKRGVKYVKPLPGFGNMLPVITQSMNMCELLDTLYKKYPEERYVGIFQFTIPILLVRDPELIKKITIKNFENFADHTGYMSEEIDPLWAKNLFAIQGERWHDLRQTLSPVFTSSKMRAMFVLMDECAKQLTNYFQQQNKTVVEVEMKDVATRYANDVIATTAFGIKCDSLKAQNNEFLLAGRELTNFTGLNRFKFLLYGVYPRIAKLFNIKIISDRVGNFFRSIINETIRVREQKNILRPDLINSLMLARNGKLKYEDYLNLPEAGFAAVQESDMGKTAKKTQFLTNEDITAQALVFFFGGFDTASTMVCFAAHELAVNPEIQKRLKQEIARTWHEANGKFTYECLLNMKYLDMVISETLRKWSQGIWLDRRCTKAFEIEPEKEGELKLQINVGDACWVPVFAIHRDPKYYPNPDVFDPERFSDENKDNIKVTTYLPFGTGPRNCIGSRFALLEAKILFFYLLIDFDIVPTSKTQIPLKLSRADVLLRAEKGFHVGLKRTQNILR